MPTSSSKAYIKANIKAYIKAYIKYGKYLLLTSKINANVVRVRSLPGVKSRHQNIDTVIIRFVR